MQRQYITSGSTFEEEIGYSRAVVAGDWLFVSGTTGFNYQTMQLAGDDVVSQAEQCIRNIRAAISQAGFAFEDIVRVHYILPHPEEFPQCFPILKANFGTFKPAATMIGAKLSDPRMRIEIEVTAIRNPER